MSPSLLYHFNSQLTCSDSSVPTRPLTLPFSLIRPRMKGVELENQGNNLKISSYSATLHNDEPATPDL